jgi:type 1 glutamine amidotransferase
MKTGSSVVVSSFVALALCACSSGTPTRSEGAGVAGSSGPGTAGTGAGVAGGAGGSGSLGSSAGAAGTAAGAAGATTTTSGEGGAGSFAGASGSSGEAGAAGPAGASGHDGGVTATGGAAGGPTDAGAPADVASRGNRVLIYTRSTGFVHSSTPAAAAAITKSAATFGLVCETSQDQTKFTAAGLAPYAGIVLVATAGEPFGSPGTAQIQALVDYVEGGGGLVGIENANHAYDTSVPYISLVGGDFNGHSGYGPDTCFSDGMHPSNVKLPAMFSVTDEIYYTSKFNPDNQIVLRCGSDKRAISWVRTQGKGRVFYTTLGHDDHSWTMPPLVDGHVVPGLLWSMGR